MTDLPFLVLSEDVFYRGLEIPHLFHARRDEVYELETDGVRFLDELEAGKPAAELSSPDIAAFALEEGLAKRSATAQAKPIPRGSSPVPSLRYLELILTYRCNLSCRHCYQGGAKKMDLDPELLRAILSEFDAMQGIRLLLSGGEPLMYPHFGEAMELAQGRGYRTVLISNGTMLDESTVTGLTVHEVQISLDGMEDGHDALRGKGSFFRAVDGAERVRNRGMDLSVATMIHEENISELPDLERLIRDLGAREWSLEVPSRMGRWQGGTVSEQEAARLMGLGFGGSYHGSSAGFACGHHLAAVLPDGNLAKCGFYAGSPITQVQNGLRAAWEKKPIERISEIEICRDCEAAGECGGGCRFRAGGSGPDQVMCAVHGKTDS